MSPYHRVRCWLSQASHATVSRPTIDNSRHDPSGMFTNDLAPEVKSLATTRVDLEVSNLCPRNLACDPAPEGLVACDGPGGIGEVIAEKDKTREEDAESTTKSSQPSVTSGVVI